ncbi:nitroreductase family protein [Metabacillus sp. RGM 3146]|uniref:nitroreductase family protein n=1 Tax=Metabacillus sp. RGM 3146 TaxID=3401092 RepID=UPI003B9BDD9B
MDIQKAIADRRTIKKFKQDSIDESLVVSLLEKAKMAPNHRMTEPWNILFIGKETRVELKHKTDFGGAPIVFAITSSHGKTEVEHSENLAATACFIQNFLLLAWAEGIGAFWSSMGASQAVKEKLQVPADADITGILAIGYPEEIPAAKERADIQTKISYLK